MAALWLCLLGRALLGLPSVTGTFFKGHYALDNVFDAQVDSRKHDIQIVHLSNLNHPQYDFDAFGRNIKLHLKPNHKIVSNFFKSFLLDKENKSEIPAEVKSCYYLHRDNDSSAAIHFCDDNKMNGLIFYEKYVLEITPADTENILNGSRIPHIVKRNLIEQHKWNFDSGLRTKMSTSVQDINASAAIINKQAYRKADPVVEAALFFDEAAFKIFAPYFNYDIIKLRDMLLAYMNGVQALYHHPSAANPIDLTLTRLEILKTQPHDLTDHGGEREALLDSFCDYNANHNPPSDEHPEHWDIGLYVSGLDFYAIEKGKKSGVTMGLAVVGGICQVKYACVIAEFGVTNIFGKPYPSAGFTSVFVLAHEIGHSLGMHHDGYTNDCPKDGFIMSPSRGVVGETLWSRCSAQVLINLNSWAACLFDEPVITNDLDHRKFKDTPGVIWDLKKQCELLLKDPDAEPFLNQPEEKICESVQCKTPHRSGFYFAGPAMEGTLCGIGKWCQGGECVIKSGAGSVIEGGWSEWTTQACESGCILNSKGYQSRQRFCNNPPPANTNKGCDGLSYAVQTCNDHKICRDRRKTVEEYATTKCRQFANYVKEIDRIGFGLQAPHEPDRLWMGCTIFCRRHDSNSYYTPRVELNDIGINPYFPDGTWCNNDGKINYYCLQHHCLPENFEYNKNHFWKDDILLPQNAPPHSIPLPENLRKYLSTDSKGTPLLKTFTPNLNPVPEDAWATKDYIEIF